MTKDVKLTCLEKRDLLNQAAVSIETLTRWGEEYESMGLVHDAVDFFEKANAREALERLLKNAREDADIFLVKRISRILDRETSREEWLELAARAEGVKKYRFAVEAYRLGGEEEVAESLLSKSMSSPPEAELSSEAEAETA